MTHETYLAFDNAIKAGQYYKKNFNGSLNDQKSFTKEMLVGIDTDYEFPRDLSTTTFHAILEVFGRKFAVSDRIDMTSTFSDSVNFVVNYDDNEKEQFEKDVSLAKKAQGVQLLFENLTTDDGAPYKMYRFKDELGIIWCLMKF